MNCFTIISFYTPDFAHFGSTLKSDCEQFGYSHKIVEVDASDSLTEIWDRKIDYILHSIKRFGSILWLDVECRLLATIPNDWTAPLTCTFPLKGGCPVSTGLLMLSTEHIPFVKIWSKYARKYAELPDDFVLEFLLSKYDLPFNYIHTEFFDRTIPAQVVRGQWVAEGTVVQHPTTNRWQNPVVYSQTFNGSKKPNSNNGFEEEQARKRKYLYWRNFGGDFNQVEELMFTNVNRDYKISDWVFNPCAQRYSPYQYWPEITDIFGVKPLTKAKFEQYIRLGFPANKHREKALRRMRLNNEDKFLFNRTNVRSEWLKNTFWLGKF